MYRNRELKPINDGEERPIRRGNGDSESLEQDMQVERSEYAIQGDGLESRERSIRTANIERREQVTRDLAAERSYRQRQASQLIRFVVGALDGLAGLRILLKLIAANPANPFAHLVYTMTALYLAPFFGLVANPSAGSMVFEVTTLIGIVSISLIGTVIERLIVISLDRPNSRQVSFFEREKR